MLSGFDPTPLPPALRAAHELVVAGIAMRRLRIEAGARGAGAGRTRGAAGPHSPADGRSRKRRASSSTTPAARLIARGSEKPLRLDEVEALLASKALVVDACRHAACFTPAKRSRLQTRPVLFALARALAEAWPGDVSREDAACARVPRQARR